MILRVLIIESELDDILFLRDVLGEIQEGRFWHTWVHMEALAATTLAEAFAILANERVDILLLNPDLSDSQGIETFRSICTGSGHLPVVLLIGSEDVSMALQLIRDGAQDFLKKKQIDAGPLAHAMRNAMERQRLLTAARTTIAMDSLTGLMNRSAFLTLAERDRKLAERFGRRLMILIAEPKNSGEFATLSGEQRRDLTLVEGADHLRRMAGATDVIARIGETSFGISIFETDLESLEEAGARLHYFAATHRMQVGAAIFAADRPASLEVLLQQAALELAPAALAMPG
jgi:diguanylate cyclase (GGDEF)-like protein